MLLGLVERMERYLILWVRSPSAVLDDSTFSLPLLPRMLMNPRTVWACDSVAVMISASVASLVRLIIAITAAFLLARSACGLPTGFLAHAAFFADLGFAAVLR